MNRKYVSGALALGALGAIGGYIWWHRSELATVVVVSPSALALCALSTAGYLAANGLISYAMVNKLGARIGIWECLSLSLVSTGVNVLTPMQGGMVVRAVYLKRLHDFEYSRFLATLVGCQVLIVIVCSALAAAALAWMALVEDRGGLGTVLGGVAVCLGISVLAFLFPRIRAKGSWLSDRVASVSDSWYALRAQPRFLATLTVLVGLQVGGQVLSFWAGFGVIGIRMGLIEVMAAGTLGTLASILSITPGALGIYEAVVAFVGAGLGIAPIHSVMAAVVSRAVQLVLLLVLAPLAVLFLRRRAAAGEQVILSPGERPT